MVAKISTPWCHGTCFCESFIYPSYSVQKVAQTEATLPTLGASLMLPAGWTYRTRTLTADLAVKAVNGKATVVQDDNDNTYLQSQ